MNRKRITLKAIVLSLGLAAATLSAQAQGVFGDMLDNYYAEKEQSSQGGGALLRGSNRGDYTVNDGGISNYGLGETAPLGSGIAIMLVAGLGYVAFKKKED